MTENYLNLSESEIDKPVYRIIPIDRLCQMFSEKTNVLVSPKKWDDPFENFIMRSTLEFGNGEFGSIGFCDNFYGQCWTTHKASDAMWRIYSHDTEGVRIRTTIRKLLESLKQNQDEWVNSQCFIGKVKYLPNKKLLNFANAVFSGLPKPATFAKTLLVKRPAFEHEKEVRLIYFDRNGEVNNGLYAYKIDPHELIDQIMVDPRVTANDYSKIKENIIQSTGYNGLIKRSLLYAAPKNMIFKFG